MNDNLIKARKIVKKAIVAIGLLIILLSMVVGVLTSDFKKIKKFDEKDKSARELISSIKASSKSGYYNTEISINSKNSIVNLGDFTFNIGSDKMLITNISFKYKSKKTTDIWSNDDDDIEKEIHKKSVILRDSVINTMIGSFASTSNGDIIKRDIKRNINKELSSGEVEEVYFNKFIFQ